MRAEPRSQAASTLTLPSKTQSLMPKLGQCLLFILLYLAQAAHSATTPSVIKFSCASMPHQTDFIFAFNQYKTALEKLGINFEMTHVPKDKITSTMFETEFDGDCGRIPAFTQIFNVKNTLIIDPPIRTAQFNTWKLRSDKTPRRNPELKVQTISQISSIDPYLEQMGFQVIDRRDSIARLVHRLRLGKIDRIIAYQAAIETEKAVNDYRDIVRDKDILILPVRGLLHKRHQAIAAPLSRELNAITETLRASAENARKKTHIRPPTPNRVKTITFSCSIPPEHKNNKLIEDLYRQIFEPLGYHYEQKNVTIQEENNLLKRDQIDGSCGRSREQNDEGHFAILDVPLARVTLRLWSNQAHPDFTLLNHIPADRRIVVAGLTNRLRKMLAPLANTITSVDNATQAFRFLTSKRADYFLSSNHARISHLHSLEIKQPLFWGGSMDYGYVYPYLSKRHQNLLTPLRRELVRLQGSAPTLVPSSLPDSESNH